LKVASLAAIAILPALAMLAGCGGESTTGVSGSVTFNGKPVTAGVINFLPSKGQPLGGALQPDGTFSFDLPPGEYKVRIDSPAPAAAGSQETSAVSSSIPTPQPASGKPGEAQVPPQYASYETSGLTLTVGDESSQQHDFKLP